MYRPCMSYVLWNESTCVDLRCMLVYVFGGLDMRGMASEAENELQARAVLGRVYKLALSDWRCSGDIEKCALVFVLEYGTL